MIFVGLPAGLFEISLLAFYQLHYFISNLMFPSRVVPFRVFRVLRCPLIKGLCCHNFIILRFWISLEYMMINSCS